MNCKNCKDNYLLKIFQQCMNHHEVYNDALEEFTYICTRCKDPRSSVMILYSISDNDCETCKKFKEYYKSFLE